MATVTSRSGRIAPVCQDCGRRGKYGSPTPRGRVNLGEIGVGWSVAPFPEDVVHPDGSKGSLYRCPACDADLLRRTLVRDSS